MKEFSINQFVSGDFCLSCPGCCRYNCNPSIWAPKLLELEKKALNLDKIELKEYKGAYICRFLNPENNLCGIYNRRPLECRLYPFLINRSGERLYLSLDSRCPGASGKTDSQEFRQYLDYLVGYLKTPLLLNILKKNIDNFSSYPDDEILNLFELTYGI